jgi:hypothetical protein
MPAERDISLFSFLLVFPEQQNPCGLLAFNSGSLYHETEVPYVHLSQKSAFQLLPKELISLVDNIIRIWRFKIEAQIGEEAVDCGITKH